ncbi:uncharacterized protein N7529_008714 [Penicillium soppii]|jgi:hypothetical protein|uniref:uncharacterized protein n=1 Tax=Penicillium soppii TaxID=69789 RepID=UPI002546757D|nr:uncharacterized protein N7529_008714 [Penicillium soppii]KAJ5861404.1 hypothetical protein N7529_008714 [Penicillium soppii]
MRYQSLRSEIQTAWETEKTNQSELLPHILTHALELASLPSGDTLNSRPTPQGTGADGEMRSTALPAGKKRLLRWFDEK